MLIGWFVLLFTSFFNLLASFSDPHYFDFHFSQNSNLLAFVSYMMQCNHFFPIDTYLLISGLYSSVYIIMGLIKVVEVVLNLVRGSGLKL